MHNNSIAIKTDKRLKLNYWVIYKGRFTAIFEYIPTKSDYIAAKKYLIVALAANQNGGRRYQIQCVRVEYAV